MANKLRKLQKPLALSTTSPTNVGASNTPSVIAQPPLSFNGVNLTSPGPVPAPMLPGMSSGIAASIQKSQDAANKANDTRYQQGLGVLTGGYNNAGQSIQGAIDSSDLYGSTAKQQLGLQLQAGLGQQAQSAVSRGLTNTTIADTMKDLPQRQYNDAVNQVTEQQANRKSGLLLDQANNQSQAGNSISNFIAARNDQGPNLSQYASLVQGAAARPNGGVVSGGGGGGSNSFGDSSPFPSDSKLPNKSGGANSPSSGGPGGYLPPGQAGGNNMSPTQGYTGASGGGANQPPAPTDPGPSNSMTQAGYAPGSVSISGGTPMTSAAPPTPISTTVQPQSQQIQPPAGPNIPCPFYQAMQGLCNDGTDRSTNGKPGGIA